MEKTWPAYLEAYESGALMERRDRALGALAGCRLCPRGCGVDRAGGQLGYCKTGRKAVVASYSPHHGEEGVLRGREGSGTIFFSGCNLRCVFCQNWETSRGLEGREETADVIAAMMLKLQEQGCHNINLVTPSHVVPQILEALFLAVEAGLKLPLVYNSGGYDSVETLRLLDGIVDVYMPDFKVWDPDRAERYFSARDYPERARAAISEMRRQVGELESDPASGTARRGVLLRHLVMPGMVADSRNIFAWVARELSRDTYVNVMAQYRPAGEVRSSTAYPELAREMAQSEYERALAAAEQAGLWRFESKS